MSVAIEIAGHGAYVRIDVLGYENPDAQGTSDANWLTCRVEVSVNGFEGRADAAFATHDFADFGRSLRAAVTAVNGEARFETDEDALRLSVEFRRTGTASITGTLRDPDRSNNTLTFSFESDQAYLRYTVDALAQVNVAFPVRT